MGKQVHFDVVEVEKAAPAPAPAWTPTRQEWAVMVTIAIISLMVALDATVLVPVLPTLALELDGSASDAFWAGTSYLLACAVSQPVIASLSEIFGRRALLLTSLVFFAAGTAVCAPVARGFPALFAGRALQGVGGGGIVTLGQVLYADLVPLRQRPRYFTIVLASWALGTVLGPLIGGFVVERYSWRWCFYINFPFCLFGLILVPIYVKLRAEESTLASKLQRVDWIGGFLFLTGMTSFLVGLSWAGVQYDWLSVPTLLPMSLGITGVVWAVLWDCHGAREPMLRPSLFRSRSAVAAYTCAFLQGFVLFCAFFYIPFYFVAVRSASPTRAGINLFPISCLLVPGSIVVSVLASRLGRFRWALWAGWATTAAGCGLLRLLDVGTAAPVWAAALAVLGVGNGMALTSVNVAVQAAAAPRDSGAAAALYACARTLGMAVGGTAFQNAMAARLRALGLPERIARDAEAFAAARLPRLGPHDPLRRAALDAYVHGFRAVFWVLTGAACAGFLVSLAVRRHSMDKDLESDFALAVGARPGAGGGGHELAKAASPSSSFSSSPVAGSFQPPHGRLAPINGPAPDDEAPASRFSEDSCDLTPLLPVRSAGGGAAADDAAAEKYGGPRTPYGDLCPVTVMRPIERAPAVSFYVTAAGRRLPVDLSDRQKRGAALAAALAAALRAVPLRPQLAHHHHHHHHHAGAAASKRGTAEMTALLKSLEGC